MCKRLKDRSEVFTLGVEGILALLVLGDFVRLVLLALLAVSPAGFRHVHLRNKPQTMTSLDKIGTTWNLSLKTRASESSDKD